VPVDVGVDHAHRQATRRERGGEVHRHRGLAHAALAARDRVDASTRGRLGERDHRLGAGAAAQAVLQFLALLGRHHAEVHHHSGDAGDGAGGGGDVPLQGVTHRAAGDREQYPDRGDASVVDGDGLDHAQLGDRAANLRIAHLGQRGQDGVFVRRGGSGHDSNPMPVRP
jgi:hypothetical protein